MKATAECCSLSFAISLVSLFLIFTSQLSALLRALAFSVLPDSWQSKFSTRQYDYIFVPFSLRMPKHACFSDELELTKYLNFTERPKSGTSWYRRHFFIDRSLSQAQCFVSFRSCKLSTVSASLNTACAVIAAAQHFYWQLSIFIGQLLITRDW